MPHSGRRPRGDVLGRRSLAKGPIGHPCLPASSTPESPVERGGVFCGRNADRGSDHGRRAFREHQPGRGAPAVRAGPPHGGRNRRDVTEREGSRVSFRNAVPYVLQSDDVIVNKTTLLRGANDERRTSIADSLPYFLGTVDKSTRPGRDEAPPASDQHKRKARRVEASARVADRERDRSLALLTEAAQLGMIDGMPADPVPDVLVTVLQRVAGWQTVPAAMAEADQLQGLYANEHDYVSSTRH